MWSHNTLWSESIVDVQAFHYYTTDLFQTHTPTVQTLKPAQGLYRFRNSIFKHKHLKLMCQEVKWVGQTPNTFLHFFSNITVSDCHRKVL